MSLNDWDFCDCYGCVPLDTGLDLRERRRWSKDVSFEFVGVGMDA